MKISVILPSYKPQEYIWKCLDSLTSQTMDVNEYEIVIVLNGCNEPYYSQISEYISKTKHNIRLLQTDSGGVSNARNIGISEAKGEYICFVDDDDWVSETYLEKLLLAVGGGEDCAIANVINYDEEAGTMKKDWLTACYERNEGRKPTLLSCRSYMSVACCKITRHTTIGDVRFDTNYKQGEDALFFAEISKNTRNIGIAESDAIYYRRLRKTSAARARSKMQKTRDNFRLLAAFARMYSRDIKNYDARFFMTRFLACFKAMMRSVL